MIAQAAYDLLARWGTGRRIVVVEPVTLEGARLCVQHGARQVFVISNSLSPEPDLDVRAATRRLPLRDASVDIVMFVSPSITLAGSSCAIQLADAARVLSASGFVGVVLNDSLQGHDQEHIRNKLAEPFQELRCAVGPEGPLVLLGSRTAPIRGLHSDPCVRSVDASAGDADRAVSANLGRELHPADVLVDRQRLRQELTRRTAALRTAEGNQTQAEEELRRERLENVRLVAEIDRMREELERNRQFEEQRTTKLEQLGAELSQLEREHAELRAVASCSEEPSPANTNRAALERAVAREHRAVQQVQRSADELAGTRKHVTLLRRALTEKSSQVAKLGAELDVVKIQLQQAREYGAMTEAVVEEGRQAIRQNEGTIQALRRQLELLAGEYQHARHGLEQRGLRITELEALLVEAGCPTLQASEWTSVRRLALEGTVRAEEQEYLLIQLDKAEQRIWEMVDATDRSAARLAAGLAQLEKQKEQYDELLDDLEFNRGLLASARTRMNDLERILSIEHTKLARAGIAAETLPTDVPMPGTASVGDMILDALVDDDEDLREALGEQLLMTEDFDVFEAGNGAEAMTKAKEGL
ncbi:MAG: hypothetical protein ACPG77_02415, partial [Nannocystaceae bacterium]